MRMKISVHHMLHVCIYVIDVCVGGGGHLSFFLEYPHMLVNKHSEETSVCVCVHAPVRVFFLFVCVCVYVGLFVCLFVGLFVCLFVGLCFCLVVSVHISPW